MASQRTVTNSNLGPITVKASADSGVRVISIASQGTLMSTRESRQEQVLWALTVDTTRLSWPTFFEHDNWPRKHQQFTIASSDPGIVSISLAISMRHSMNIANRWLITSAEKGVRNNLWVSMAKDFKSGKHYEPVGVGCLASKEAQDDASAKESWDWTRRKLQAHSA
ncbi:short-chain dehydrogenase reductase [Colletotrichum incanum]|uniref:Short-chain dehydrogenase reductase n=1 Tax=Colletotrichum incanum TaxID=1573173 RepID=A0A167BLX0_COLIC|nr:short-chain dehydrogenase reductase [Colletotrichum incanum]